MVKQFSGRWEPSEHDRFVKAWEKWIQEMEKIFQLELGQGLQINAVPSTKKLKVK